MRCQNPDYCICDKCKVTSTRPVLVQGERYLRRRRKCSDCGYSFATLELPMAGSEAVTIKLLGVIQSLGL